MSFSRERDLLNWIIAIAETFGWLTKHVSAPMVAARAGGFVGSKRAKGLPDLFLLSDDPALLIIAEVKGEKGELSEEQVEFLQAAQEIVTAIRIDYHDLVCAGADSPRPRARIGVYVWTPADEKIIDQILRTKVLL